MLTGAGLIAGLVFTCLFVAFRRPHPGKPSNGFWLGGMGVAFPTVTLTALLIYALMTGERLLPHPGAADVLRVDGTARQWAWRFDFPAGGPAAIDGGPLIIPVGRPVDFHVTSEDVVHSLWIPRLGGKIDALPGHVNIIRLIASEPGQFGAQCAEFCGEGHAGMFFWVQALPADEFDQLAGSAR